MEFGNSPVLTVREFYGLLTNHLEESFGRRHPLWIRGEIAKVYEKSHIYVDLIDPDDPDAKPALVNVHCWLSGWGPLKKKLAAEGIELKAGMVVSLKGYVDIYAPQGRIGFTFTDVNVAEILGEAAKRRAELLAKLEAEGIFILNKELKLASVPLKVGLVASQGTEGFSDFTGQLLTSGRAFLIRHVQSLVQGDQAPAQIIKGLTALEKSDVDIICLVRGGGSKSDLACFDDERLVRAIAKCAKPVFTGIGHTGDHSIADMAAHTNAITPTKLGETIVALVNVWRDAHVVGPAGALLAGTEAILDDATNYLGERRRTVVFAVRDRIRSEQRQLANTASHLAHQVKNLISIKRTYLVSSRQLVSAYDPARRLAQGWAVLTDAKGEVIRSTNQVNTGDTLTARVLDGSIETTVTKKNGAT
jgi:exodeoxyribonuclease VII large subunit